MMQQIKPILLAAAAAALLAGCSSVDLDENKGATGQNLADVVTRDASSEEAARKALEQNRSIYFAFDSYAIESQYLPVVQLHAKYLLSRPQAQVVIEGNTDARGSREYNLALGQRRSEAVKQRLQLLGVPSSRMETVSFGREKPVALGNNEEAWAKNRRADINYR